MSTPFTEKNFSYICITQSNYSFGIAKDYSSEIFLQPTPCYMAFEGKESFSFGHAAYNSPSEIRFGIFDDPKIIQSKLNKCNDHSLQIFIHKTTDHTKIVKEVLPVNDCYNLFIHNVIESFKETIRDRDYILDKVFVFLGNDIGQEINEQIKDILNIAAQANKFEIKIVDTMEAFGVRLAIADCGFINPCNRRQCQFLAIDFGITHIRLTMYRGKPSNIEGYYYDIEQVADGVVDFRRDDFEKKYFEILSEVSNFEFVHPDTTKPHGMKERNELLETANQFYTYNSSRLYIKDSHCGTFEFDVNTVVNAHREFFIPYFTGITKFIFDHYDPKYSKELKYLFVGEINYIFRKIFDDSYIYSFKRIEDFIREYHPEYTKETRKDFENVKNLMSKRILDGDFIDGIEKISMCHFEIGYRMIYNAGAYYMRLHRSDFKSEKVPSMEIPKEISRYQFLGDCRIVLEQEYREREKILEKVRREKRAMQLMASKQKDVTFDADMFDYCVNVGLEINRFSLGFKIMYLQWRRNFCSDDLFIPYIPNSKDRLF